MTNLKITGIGPILTFDGDDYSFSDKGFAKKVKVYADDVDITNKIGEPIYGPCIEALSDFAPYSIMAENEETRWETEINISVDNFDPSKLRLYFSCDSRNKEDGEFSDYCFDGAELLKASYLGNVVKYDGKNFYGDVERASDDFDYAEFD